MKKTYKIIFFTFCLLLISSSIYYLNLNNRHKAIVKTFVFHTFKIVESNWIKDRTPKEILLISPSFYIDNIYKSMEGPKASTYFTLNKKKDELNWMTAFHVKTIDSKTHKQLSNDFFCHFNINYQDEYHHGKWNLLNRVNKQYPRLLSLSNGIEEIKFPKGFGFPFFSNEKFFITTQTLNHNVVDSSFSVKHQINVEYCTEKKLKPLYPKTIYMMLPFDTDGINVSKNEIPLNNCIPVETKNHTYYNNKGEMLSGHWKIFKERKKYTFNATKQLDIKDTVTLHQITPHLHPFAKNNILKDLTRDVIIYNCKAINNHKNIGLTNTPAFSSEKGIKMYPTHEYELELTTDCNLDEPQDMMASMFLFFYDKELDIKIKKYQYESQ